MKTIDVMGVRVGYRVDGQGPGLVLVHGTGGNGHSNWGHLVDRFAAMRTVVRTDFSGSGDTVDADEHLSVEKLALQVIAAARAADALPFDLVGFSLGAGVAAYIAAEFPELVRSVVLLAGFASGENARLQMQLELWQQLIRTDRRNLARLILLTGFTPAFVASMNREQIDASVEAILADNQWEGMAQLAALDRRLDVRAQLERIASPALVIGCGQDQIVPPAHARELAAIIPGAQYKELPCGHLAPLECPDAFCALVIDFLAKQQRHQR